MRIIAGKFKGRKLDFVSTDILRPTADFVREALFTKLQFNNKKRVLDMFAGTGAVGIEALSRGSEQVVFIEKNIKHAKLIENNLKSLKVDYRFNSLDEEVDAIIFTSDFETVLNKIKVKFNLIYIDPPYKSEYYEVALRLIKTLDILEKDGIIVLEHEADKQINFLGYNLQSQKSYGRKHLTYLTI